MFIFSFKSGNDDPKRNPFDKYYMPLVEIKDFNALVANKSFFDQLVKNKQEAYEKLVEMSRNNDYTTKNLLDYLYHQNYYKLIGIDLSRQTNTSIPQQINFRGKSEEYDGATMLFVSEKQKKTILIFSLDSLVVTEYCNIITSKNIKFFEWSKRFWICGKKMEHCQWSIKCKLRWRKWNYL